MADAPFLVHNCNPANPGKPLPFGKPDPTGRCPRCAERARERAEGIPAREAPHGIREAVARQAEDDRRAAEIRQHFASGEHAERCQRGNPSAVTTCYDW